jgi:hypothetical protein
MIDSQNTICKAAARNKPFVDKADARGEQKAA